MLRYAAVVLLALVPAATFAEDLPKEIIGFRNITVSFSQGAEKCNVTDEASFANHLKDELGKIGIKEDPSLVMTAHLAISAQAFGMLNVNCAQNVVMNFQTALSSENIVTENPRVRQAVDRLGQIPIIVYQDGMFGVTAQREPMAGGGPSTSVSEAVMNMTTEMVKRLDTRRKQ